MDKVHINLWLAVALDKAIQDSKFVGIVRNPFQVVSSMLQWDDVRVQYANQKVVLSRFHGVTKENLDHCKTMTVEERMTVRWLAHYQRLMAVSKKLGRFFLLRYSRLADDPQGTLAQMRGSLGLSCDLRTEVRSESLTKYKESLGEERIDRIRKVLAKYAPALNPDAV